MSGTNECLTKTKPCGCRIMAITPAFQAGDVGSIPIIRLKLLSKISSFFLLKSILYNINGSMKSLHQQKKGIAT